MRKREKETKNEFEQRYSKAYPTAVFGGNIVAMPCTCDEDAGPIHWAAITNTPEAIQAHLSHEEVLKDLRERDV